MARGFREPIEGSTVKAPTGETVGLGTQVSPIATPTYVPGSNPLLEIAQGLQSLNPGLARISEQQIAKDREAAIKDARAKAIKDKYDQTKMDLAPAEAPEAIPRAVRTDWLNAYRETIDNSAASEAATEFRTRFLAEHKNPDFNFGEFSNSFIKEQIAGAKQPGTIATMGAHLDREKERLAGVFAEYTQQQVDIKSKEALISDFGQVTSAASPESNWIVAKAAIDSYHSRGGTRAEGADMLFQSVLAQSVKLNGKPELFDVFEQTDPATGMSIAQMNPRLADNIAKAREQEAARRDKAFRKQNYDTIAEVRDTFQTNLENGTFNDWTDKDVRDLFMQHAGPGAAFQGENDLAEFMGKVRARRAKVETEQRAGVYAAQRQLGALPEKEQKDFLEATLDRDLKELLWATGREGDGNYQAAARRIFQTVDASGASVPAPQLKGFLASVAAEVPAAGALPTPKFKAAAEMYQTMMASSNPGLVAKYFDGDTLTLMENYTSSYTRGGVDNASAYQLAYKAISPEAKRAAEELLKDPAKVKKLKDDAYQAVVPWYTRWSNKLNPFSDRIDPTVMQSDAMIEAESYLRRNPQNADKLSEHLERWSEANYFRDPNTNRFIKIPPAMNDEFTKDAVSNYLSMLTEAQGKDRGATLLYNGGDRYTVFNGRDQQILGEVRLGDMVRIRAAQKFVAPEELATLKDLKDKAIKGTLTADDLDANKGLIGRASKVGMWDEEASRKLYASRDIAQTRSPLYSTMTSELRKDPDRAMPKVDVTPDSTITRSAVDTFVKNRDYAGALTAMGEGVKLKAYTAPEGKRTIGIGYNLEANAKNIESDFRKAGIPAEAVAGVVAGQVAITPEQAVRLYGVARTRYDTMARLAVENQVPGAWDTLPANAKAVFSDMAYQLGPNVKQFEKGIAALIRGDLSGEELKVTYLDKKSGTRKYDERRHALRVALLNSATTFQSVTNYVSRQPASTFESLTR